MTQGNAPPNTPPVATGTGADATGTAGATPTGSNPSGAPGTTTPQGFQLPLVYNGVPAPGNTAVTNTTTAKSPSNVADPSLQMLQYLADAITKKKEVPQLDAPRVGGVNDVGVWTGHGTSDDQCQEPPTA